MFEQHTWRGAVAICVVGGRMVRGAFARPRCLADPCARSTRAKLDSLATYTPSSASMGTMRAGGTSAKRGSLAKRSTSARSAALKAWAGTGRTAVGLPSPATRPPPSFQRCIMRTSLPTISPIAVRAACMTTATC
jgi:hypothetical protein